VSDEREVHRGHPPSSHGFVGISRGWKLTGAIKTAERKLADGTLRHSGQRLMSWAVANTRVEPKGNAIIITKQASGSAKIDPLMAAFNAIALMSTNPWSTRPSIFVI
jgi:phage terminase large subunit-like protein